MMAQVKYVRCSDPTRWALTNFTDQSLRFSCTKHLSEIASDDDIIRRLHPDESYCCSGEEPLSHHMAISTSVMVTARKNGLSIYGGVTFVRTLLVQLDWDETTKLRDFIDTVMLAPDPPLGEDGNPLKGQ